MPAANETINSDRRTAPDIINDIQKRLRDGSDNISTLEDVLLLDQMAKLQNPAGIPAFPLTNEYVKALGQDKGIKAIFKEASLALNSPAAKKDLARLKLQLTNLPKPNELTNLQPNTSNTPYRDWETDRKSVV